MSYNDDVDVTVECAFGVDPFADPTGNWTDVTADVRGWGTQRGRSRLLDETQAGQASVVLNNRAGTYSPWASGSTVNVFTPVRIVAVHDSVTYPIWRGFVHAWPATFPDKSDAVVTAQCVDAFRLFAMYESNLTESAEFSGTRIGNLLDTVGWPAGWRDLDTGTHMVQALSAEFDAVLSQIHRTSLVEQGLFHIAGNGDATFRDANTRIQDAAIQAEFEYAAARYSDLILSFDDTQLWNSSTVTRVDGVAQSYSDAVSVADYGQRNLHLSETLHVADGEALALAQWLVSEFGDVRARVPQVTIRPEGDPAGLWPKVLGLELWDACTLLKTAEGDDFDEQVFVEGVSHTVTITGGRTWETTFQLSPALQHDDWWILGTSQLGSGRLGY